LLPTTVFIFCFYVKSIYGEIILSLERIKKNKTMKNFKKISRDHLKTIKGGNIEGVCRPGYKYICEATGVCGPEPEAACNCYCIPII